MSEDSLIFSSLSLNAGDVANYNQRRDWRTPGKFEHDINLFTARERACMTEWIYQSPFTDCGVPITFLDNGVDNTGQVVYKVDKMNKNPDYQVQFWDNGCSHIFEVEVKVSSSVDYVTFKERDLDYLIKRYEKIKKLIALVFVGTQTYEDCEIKPFKNTKWGIITVAQMIKIKSLCPYQKEGHKKIGGISAFGKKPTFRISKKSGHFDRLGINLRRLYPEKT